MKLVGLVGGIGSGKSTVAAAFRRLGAGVLDADRLGHEVLRLPNVRAAIGGRWGQEVLAPDGEIDRKALANIVFAPPPTGPCELAVLEKLTHPEIRRHLLAEIEKMSAEGIQIAILDAPVLLKAGWKGFCDSIVYVDAPLGLRQARAQSRGWTIDEFTRREASQESVEEKRELANFVVDNSRDFKYISAQVERLWQLLLSHSG